MKNIYCLAYFILGLFIFSNCTSKSNNTSAPIAAKQAKLADLKKQISALETQANALELELNPVGKKIKTKVVNIQSFAESVFHNYIDLQGTVTADQQLFINAKMAGAVEHIYMKTGDHVNTGQTVATLDDAMIQQGMAELEQQLSFASDLYEKQKALWDQKLGTEVQYLSAKNNKESIEKRIATTKEQWQMVKVKAPINGVIDEVLIKLGQTVMPGMALARLINFSKLKIDAEVPESYAGRIKAGNAIKIYFPDIQKDFDSKITYVSPIINKVNRTFRVETALPANMKGVLPNMISIIKIIDYTNAKAIVIPINVLQKDSQGDFVMVADSLDHTWQAVKKPVTIGKFYNDLVEIKTGINPSHKIITIGYQDLIEGQKITIQHQ